MLQDMATSARSESVRLQALNLITKCLGMQREIIEGFQGIEIHLEGLETPGAAPGVMPAQRPPALPAPAKPLQITK